MIHFNMSKILIPVDFSETSLLAIKHGAFTAQLTKSTVYLMHAIAQPFTPQNLFLPSTNIEDNSRIEKIVTDKLNQLAEDIKREYGVDVKTIIKVGSASKEICNAAKEIEASLIVMGTHGYSPIEEIVIGSTALKVITKSPCPTMAMSSLADHKGYFRILMPIDTSVNTRQKVNYTLELAKTFSAAVHAVALLTDGEESEKPALEVILHQIEKLAKEKGVNFHSEIIMDVKNRATASVEMTDKLGADLIVIMTDQDAELSGFFLGPYAQQVIHLTKVPVIAIKPANLFVNDSSILSGTSGL
jgi:nucleotide-binding universal stress UspA family protein